MTVSEHCSHHLIIRETYAEDISAKARANIVKIFVQQTKANGKPRLQS